MAEAGAAGALRGAVAMLRLLNPEQRTAAAGALLLAASTLGPFSFVEVAEIVLAVGVLALLRARAQGRRFHLPFGDGTAIAAAGVWAGLLILVRLFDRPLGQNLLALACAATLTLAGARERAKRPPDDLPAEHRIPPIHRGEPARPLPAEDDDAAVEPPVGGGEPGPSPSAEDDGPGEEAPTRRVAREGAAEEPPTRRLAGEDAPRQPPGDARAGS